MGMVAGYTVLYDSDEFEEYIPEKEAIIQVGDFKLKVKVDALVKENGKWWTIEYKTTSEWSKERFLDRILMDWQPTCYMYTLERNGYNIVGVKYRCIQKPRIYQGNRENIESFGKRMTKLLIDDAKDKGRRYFYEEPIYRTPDDIREFEKSLKDVVTDIQLHKEEKWWYKNTQRCFDSRDGCEYLPICRETDEVSKKNIIETSYTKIGE